MFKRTVWSLSYLYKTAYPSKHLVGAERLYAIFAFSMYDVLLIYTSCFSNNSSKSTLIEEQTIGMDPFLCFTTFE